MDLFSIVDGLAGLSSLPVSDTADARALVTGGDVLPMHHVHGTAKPRPPEIDRGRSLATVPASASMNIASAVSYRLALFRGAATYAWPCTEIGCEAPLPPCRRFGLNRYTGYTGCHSASTLLPSILVSRQGLSWCDSARQQQQHSQRRPPTDC